VIEVDMAFDGAGLLRSCRVRGHAGAGKAGGDVVCAAVSVLVRGALRSLSGRRGIEVRGAAPERGFLWMETACTAEGKEFLSATGVFLAEGLKSVAEEYPGHCTVNFLTESEDTNGT
jgi:uncharacterized protein YsxB (DUF464 family)